MKVIKTFYQVYSLEERDKEFEKLPIDNFEERYHFETLEEAKKQFKLSGYKCKKVELRQILVLQEK